MSFVDKKLGRRIAQQRRLAGLTQAQLAEKLGVASETVSRMETGAVMPSLARIEAVGAVLGVELAELFRFRKLDTPEDKALERLVWRASRGSLEYIELVTEIATRVFEHVKHHGVTDR